MNLFAPEPTTLFKMQVGESFQGKSVHSKVEANAIAVSYIRAICTKVKVFQRISGNVTYPEFISVGTSWQGESRLNISITGPSSACLCGRHMGNSGHLTVCVFGGLARGRGGMPFSTASAALWSKAQVSSYSDWILWPRADWKGANTYFKETDTESLFHLLLST